MSGKDYITRKEIKEFLANRPPGPISCYNLYHFERILRIIDQKSPIGRNKLSEAVHLGAGSIRSIIKIIKNQKLIKSTKTGLILTQKGKNSVRKFKANIPYDSVLFDVPKNISTSTFSGILIVRGVRENFGSGLEQATAALRVNAVGASTILYHDGKYSLHEIMSDVGKENPDFIQSIEKRFKLENDDLIIIGMAKDEKTAILGAWAAGYSLLGL